ncbi:hypothetical protein [Nocardia camponoti]|uniref:Uncharacterized protein n=1 Tax=Nocardia camponoti TaxID=1616106 RepID=A0A917V3T3_9NOCA|nr:hypothetical protein [Nocardia camponoti]GGK33282.1 hypothetical protein GCM10011591_01150 [Nocardia camponoti]
MSDNIGYGELLPPRNHGTTWRESEYRLLVDHLRAGVELAETARRVGRTESAVRAALRNLVPPEESVPAGSRERSLRARLVAEPEWDWFAVVVERHANSGSGLWRTTDEHIVRIGWRRRTPMAVLAPQVGTSELAVAELLRSLGYVDSIAEVVDALGATPGQALAKRVAAARDSSATARWVLVVDGASGVSKPRNAPVARHISVHDSRRAAEAERDRVLAWHARVSSPSTDATPWWTIAERSLGARGGTTVAGVLTEREGGIRASALAVGDVIRVPGPDGLQDRIIAIAPSAPGGPVLVDLAPVAHSRVRRVVEFAADEVVEVVGQRQERAS